MEVMVCCSLSEMADYWCLRVRKLMKKPLGIACGSLEKRQEAKATSDLPVGLDYSVMLQATRGAAQKEAAGGVARIYGQLDVTPDSVAGSDQLVFKIEHRHRLVTTLAAQDLGFASGYLGLSSLTYSDAGALLTNLFWQHKSADNRWALVAGIVDVTDYVDVYALVNPWRDFSNLAFSTTGGFSAAPQLISRRPQNDDALSAWPSAIQ